MMRTGKIRGKFLACTALLAMAPAGMALAQSAGDFYKGKTVTLLIGSGEGGGYDRAGRLMARYIAPHVPGRPTIVPKNMPGASSVRAAKYFSNVAPRDGTSLGLFQPTIITNKIVRRKENYKPEAYVWLGRFASATVFDVVWHTVPINSIEDAKRNEVIVAANSATGTGATVPWALNRLIGTKFNVVKGYKSSAATGLAMERGEAQGLGSTSYEYLASKGWVAAGKVRFLYTIGLSRDSRVPNKPTLLELVKSDGDRKLMKLLAVSSTIGRALVAAPETPTDRAKALRAAFADMAKDKAFIAAAKKLKFAVDYLSGEELEGIVRDIIATPDSVAERFKSVTKPM